MPIQTLNNGEQLSVIRGKINDNFSVLNSGKEETSNKKITMTGNEASDSFFLSAKAIYNWCTSTFSKYLGDADFYKYTISRTVSSGNLTISILNYLGATPSAIAPVKVQIGGVIYTITSALSITANAGTNWINLGSAELATKEVDLFPYLRWNSVDNAMNILLSRYPSANTAGDFTASSTNEKGLISTGTLTSTDPVTNIGRFNAILSAGAGYTWSVPAISDIRNYPIYETREFSFANTVTSDGSLTGISTFSTYIIKGNTIVVKHRINWGNLTGTPNYIGFSKPFQDNYGPYVFKGIADTYSSSGHKLCTVSNTASTENVAYRLDGSAFTTGSGSIVINEFSTI